MRIVVVGPGALGCFIAGLLSKNAEVWLLDKDASRVERILQKEGIFCEGISRKWQAKVPITVRGADIGQADLVILCVKSYDTKKALVHAREVIGENTIVLTLQNGLGNAEVISEVIGQDKVLCGVTLHGVTLLEEGKVSHQGEGLTVIGNLGGKIPAQVRQVREIFNKSNLETKVSRDIKGILWSKLIINVGINAVSAVTRLKNGRLIEFEGTAEILRAAVTEAVKVAKKRRVKLIYDDPLAKVEAVCEATATNVSSMLQDVIHKKRTEVDFINGVIVRQGRSAGIPTPVNLTLVNLIKAIESSYNISV